jgi:G3E family GTPase
VDHLNTLNDTTPKIRCEGRNSVDPALIFGLDSKLYLQQDRLLVDTSHHDEVETATVYAGPHVTYSHTHSHEGHGHACSCVVNSNGQGHPAPSVEPYMVKDAALSTALGKLSKETIWRVKGFLRMDSGVHILNWAFGRYDLTAALSPDVLSGQETVKLTVMGERGEVKRQARKLAEALGASVA